MFFEVAVHFFDPHSAGITPQGYLPIGQIGGQAPGFLFADFPVNQQIGRINLFDSQVAPSQPDTLTGFVGIAPESMPLAAFPEPDTCVGFLAQNIEPMPSIQASQDRHRAKFAVSDQKNGCSSRDQAVNVAQQCHLLDRIAMSSNVLDPGPGDGDGSFAIRQTDDQQLMPKANLGAIHNQTDLSQVAKLGFQPQPGDGFIPFPYSNGWVVQQSAQAAGSAQQLGWTGDLARNSAQAYRPALIDAGHQPDKVAYLSDPLFGSQFLNPLKPGMIEPVGRHDDPPVSEFCGKNYFNRVFSADQLFFC